MVYDIGPRVARKISLGGIVTASATILFMKFEAVDIHEAARKWTADYRHLRRTHTSGHHNCQQ